MFKLNTFSKLFSIVYIFFYLISAKNAISENFKQEILINLERSLNKRNIEFIDKLTNNRSGFSREKAKNAVKTTSFENLKKLEETNGFAESITSREEKKKIPFFHLGPKNNWQKNFDKEFVEKLNNIFKKNLIELGYK